MSEPELGTQSPAESEAEAGNETGTNETGAPRLAPALVVAAGVFAATALPLGDTGSAIAKEASATTPAPITHVAPQTPAHVTRHRTQARRSQRQVTRTAHPRKWKARASWYGPGWIGKKTANGEIYTGQQQTAAHPSLPFGTLVRVTNLKNGKSAVVRINDRGPYKPGRDLDVSEAAARDLGMMKDGVVMVALAVVGHVDAKTAA